MQVRLAAIPSPINMLNLQASGWWPTIWARMVQAERHARGCADFAYCLKHARSMPKFSWTTVALCLKVCKRPPLPETPALSESPLLAMSSFACSSVHLHQCLTLLLGKVLKDAQIKEKRWYDRE
jgi:hypothetical protein